MLVVIFKSFYTFALFLHCMSFCTHAPVFRKSVSQKPKRVARVARAGVTLAVSNTCENNMFSYEL